MTAKFLAQVIEREPDWTRVPADLSPRIQDVLRRCLEKDPRKRRRDMGDVLLDLDPLPMEKSGASKAPRMRVAWLAAMLALAGWRISRTNQDATRSTCGRSWSLRLPAPS